jgi:hypothetical protein
MQQHKISAEMIEGAVSVEEGEGWLRPWRLPHTAQKLFPSTGTRETIVNDSGMSSGVRLRFATNSRNVKLNFCELTEKTTSFELSSPRKFDLRIVETGFCNTQEVTSEKTSAMFDNLPEGEKVIEIWMPHKGHSVQLSGVDVDDNASFSLNKNAGLKWITYGSSITHCYYSESPSMIWPSIVAREKNFNLRSLGFGAQCHLDPMVAKVIRDLPADFISLKIGINIYAQSFSPRTYMSSIIGFIETLREKHIETPIAVISSVICPKYEGEKDEKNIHGFTLEDMRLQTLEAVRLVQDCRKDENLYFFSGKELLENKPEYFCVDDLHPNAEGDKVIAKNFMEKVLPNIKFK